MTNNLTENDEARVLAFADNALSQSEREATKQWIDATPNAQILLAQLERSAIPFKEVMEPLLEPTSPHIASKYLATDVTNSTGRFWGQAVGALAVLGFGLFIGSFLSKPAADLPFQTEDWVAQVANYQQLYVRPTVDVAGPIDASALAQMIEKNLGQKTPIPDFSPQGVTFRRGQLLQVNGNPLIQLAYLPETGLPVALCIMKKKAETNSQVVAGESHGLNYRSWSKDGLHFVLLGKLPESEIQSLTESALMQLNAT